MPTPPLIDDTDLNTIQNSVEALLGTGTGTRGYGQVLQSTDVFQNQQISLAHFTTLRDDILSLRYHQDGTIPFTPTLSQNIPIQQSVLTTFRNLVNQADANRFNIAAGQSVVSTVATQTTTTPWSTQAQAELTVTFANSNQARYFFNSGGKIQFIGNRNGGTASAQNNAWTNFLTNISTVSFGAATGGVTTYYTLTNAYQIYYQNSLSTPYSANFVRLEARTDVANNSSGTATQLFIRITLRDNYVDPGSPPPGDSVSGSLSFNIQELKASGGLFPAGSGSWNIVSPTYSLSVITVS